MLVFCNIYHLSSGKFSYVIKFKLEFGAILNTPDKDEFMVYKANQINTIFQLLTYATTCMNVRRKKTSESIHTGENDKM